MEKRVLGCTGEKLSIVGFGGIIVAKQEQRNANNYVAEAIDAGINYFDVAPTYYDAEEHLGPALAGKREGVFLACKTENRTKKGSEEFLHKSLKNLQTDHFDLYQFHAVTTLEDVKQIFGPNGAMETYLKAKQEGLIKHIGFSAHSETAALAMMEAFDFDSVLFPINFVNIFNANFAPKVIDKAKEKSMGILALKAMALTNWAEGAVRNYPMAWYEPIADQKLASLAFRYTLSQGITAAVPPGDIEHLRWAISATADFKALTMEEEEQLRVLAKGVKPIFSQQ